MAGTLYVVATPLGNLDHLSPRAAATLKQAAAVAAEDTRHTKILLAHVGSRAELVSFHAHSPESALRRILHLLGTGKDVALVTDAGTPAVSDPGAVLVAAARARDVPVVTIPGPTAVAAALAVSGLSADRIIRELRYKLAFAHLLSGHKRDFIKAFLQAFPVIPL